MANQLYELTKIIQLTPREGTEEDKELTWLPVTCLDKQQNRVTVRMPYPRGDGDVVNTEECGICDGLGHVQHEICKACKGTGSAMCPTCGGTGSVGCDTCPTCHGTKHHGPCDNCGNKGYILVPSEDGEECEACGGTGYKAAGQGAIYIDDNGVVSLAYDEVTLGINPEGKLFAKVNAYVKLHENGGLAFDDTVEHGLYVKVDDSTIKIDDEGYIYIPNFVEQSVDESASLVVDAETEYGFDFYRFTIPEGFTSVKVHVDLGFNNPDYDNANTMTRFSLQLNDGDVGTYCIDNTVPYSMISFDKVIPAGTYVVGISTLSDDGGDDTFVIGSSVKWNVNVVSC